MVWRNAPTRVRRRESREGFLLIQDEAVQLEPIQLLDACELQMELSLAVRAVHAPYDLSH